MDDKETAPATVAIEVAYALPDKQRIISLDVPEGTTAQQAAELSGITDEFPGLELQGAAMGVFGKAVKAIDYQVQAGDRVEIYRPLLVDPKEVRKARAAKAKASREQ